MDYNELKEAFAKRSPVMYKSSAYKEISLIGFCWIKGSITYVADLIDQCGRSEARVLGKLVERIPEKNEQEE